MYEHSFINLTLLFSDINIEGYKTDNCDILTIEASVVTGFECAAKEEVKTKLDITDADVKGKDREAFRTLVESLVQMTTFISRIFLKLVELQFKVPISAE